MMVRVIVLFVLVFGVAVVSWWVTRRRVPAPTYGREVVIDDEIQTAARDNYRLLARSVGLHQQVLDADAVLPFLSAEQRRELLAVVSEFNEKPTRGTR